MEPTDTPTRPNGRNRQVALWGTAVVAAHTLLTTLHTIAHVQLDVFLNLWQNAYVTVVIIIGPIAAAVALWTKHQRAGAWGVLLTMTGALLFAGFFHFVHISPDHVAHLPEGPGQRLFQITAVAMALINTAAIPIGIWAIRRDR
jgi:cytochrome bd-type quinol oxidase subunit 2